MGWFTHPELLISLSTLQSMLLWWIQLFHSFEALELQVLVLMYLVVFPQICFPLPMFASNWFPLFTNVINCYLSLLYINFLYLFLDPFIMKILSSSSKILQFMFLLLTCCSTVFSPIYLLWWTRWLWTIQTIIYKFWKGLLKSKQMPSVNVVILPMCKQFFLHFFFVLRFCWLPPFNRFNIGVFHLLFGM